MTINEFKNRAECTEFNSCNGWGFGGSYGKIYKYNTFIFKDLRMSTRHRGTSPNKGYYFNEVEVSKMYFENELSQIN